jgi:predicted metal-dependent enzyme (double-stranded beta helix superfamily)
MLDRLPRDGAVFPSLIADLHAIYSKFDSEASIVANVADRLAAADDERRRLVGQYRTVAPKQYTQNVVYLDPERRFSVVALTWAPGAQTCIHDHAGWCAVTVFEGVEHEKRYRHCTDTERPYLVETGSRALEPGCTLGMVADGLDIHRVGNYSNEVTISLHVYGIDIARVGTSIKSRFDGLLVRA